VDDNLGYLFAAFAVTWIAIAAYLLYLGQQVRSLRDELEAGPDAERPDEI
jgi:CcmD family protein